MKDSTNVAQRTTVLLNGMAASSHERGSRPGCEHGTGNRDLRSSHTKKRTKGGHCPYSWIDALHELRLVRLDRPTCNRETAGH